MKGITLLKGEIIAKDYKYTETFFKIFFRTSWPNSIEIQIIVG
jgi:hypothetical protein